MSNVLKVSTPLTGYDNNISQPRANAGERATDTRIQGPAVPDQVVRPDARSDAAQEQNIKFQYQSNFEGFLSQVRENGAVTEEFATALFERLGMMVKSGMGEDTAQEMGQLLNMIQVDPQSMLAFVKNQGDAANRFQGAFFSLLRQVMNETQNVELRAGILDFAKRYTDMAEGDHLLKQIRQTLEQIKAGMFDSGKQQMEKMEQAVNFGRLEGRQSSGDSALDALMRFAMPGEAADNAAVIKEEILPYLNQYIGKTHDRGNVRESSALLAALTARYENGDASRVLSKFEELLEYPLMQKYFKGFKSDDLMRALATTDFEKAAGQSKWMDEFARLLEEGIAKGANMEQKLAFQNMMTSVLLNESVYMPLLHLMLPMQMDDKLMYAEMWVDPDAEGNTEADEKERTIQGLVKFDIQDLGFFDLFFVYQGGDVNLQLNYPEALSAKEKDIRDGLSEILSRNGLKAKELYLGSSKESIALSDAFPQIFEKRNSVNVKV